MAETDRRRAWRSAASASSAATHGRTRRWAPSSGTCSGSQPITVDGVGAELFAAANGDVLAVAPPYEEDDTTERTVGLDRRRSRRRDRASSHAGGRRDRRGQRERPLALHPLPRAGREAVRARRGARRPGRRLIEPELQLDKGPGSGPSSTCLCVARGGSPLLERRAASGSPPGAEALGQVRQPHDAVTGMLGEEVVDVLQHRRPLLVGEDGAVAAGQHELAQRLPVDLLDVAEGACSTGPNRPLASIGSTAPRSTPVLPTIASLSSVTQASLSSRTFQTSATRPPGRSTRAISRSAGPWSNQWNACAAVTTSTLSAASGIASAPPSTAVASGTPRAGASSISGSGSTAVTRCPSATRDRVSLPVPAPRSTTSHGSSPASQRTASSG